MTDEQLEQLLEVYGLVYILEISDVSEFEVLRYLLDSHFDIVLPETLPVG